MKSFRETLKMAEPVPKMGIPKMSESFDQWGEDIKKYTETVWPELAEWALMDLATKIHININFCSPIEQKMYLALQRKYIGYFINYPDTTALLVNRNLSDISRFLIEHGQKAIYSRGDVDFEIDLFLYLDCFLIDGTHNTRLRFPFWICIECDGHEYHEKTKEQAKKDKSKDRMLKAKNLDVVHFTGSEITSEPDKCVEEIDKLINAHFEKLKEILNKI